MGMPHAKSLCSRATHDIPRPQHRAGSLYTGCLLVLLSPCPLRDLFLLCLPPSRHRSSSVLPAGAGLCLQATLSSHMFPFRVACRCDLEATKSPSPEPAHHPWATMSQPEDDQMLTGALVRNSDKFPRQNPQMGESVISDFPAGMLKGLL